MDPGAAYSLKIVFGIIGLLCLVFGYLIGVKKKLTLIAGYNPDKVRDKEGLARFMGIITAIVGFVMILYPWVYGPGSTTPPRWFAYFPIPIVIIIVTLIYLAVFERDDERAN